jgi:hypothetical protein
MEFARERELVYLRHELRRLLADGRRAEAAPLLDRLRRLADDEAVRNSALGPEISRWESTFGLPEGL